MAKNLIPEICKMLGVEIGEEFKVKGREYIFHFVDHGLIAYRTDGSVLPYENCLAHFLCLINGEEEIVKLPWKPKKGERYWGFFCSPRNDAWLLCLYTWGNTPEDFSFYKAGWVFRTKEEAKAALPAVAKEMGVEYEI